MIFDLRLRLRLLRDAGNDEKRDSVSPDNGIRGQASTE